MATNLTAEELRRLQDTLAMRASNDFFIDADGNVVQTMYANPGSYQGESSYQEAGPTSYRKYKHIQGEGSTGFGSGVARYNDTPYEEYDLQGQHTGTGTWSDLGDGPNLKHAIAAAAAMYGAGLGLQNLGFNYVPGAEGLGGTASAVGELGANGAFLGEGTHGAGVWTDAGGLVGGGGAAGAGAAGGAGGGAAGGTGLLGKAAGALGGGSGLLGAAATALGGLAGAQGTPGQSSDRKLDPRMDPYVFGEGGLVPQVHGLLQQQAPIARNTGDMMNKYAQGLLGRGVAPNPFLKG